MKNVRLFFCSVIFCMVTVELLLRIFTLPTGHQGLPRGLYVSDQDLGYKLEENFIGRHGGQLSSEWNVVIKTNSLGFPDHEHSYYRNFGKSGLKKRVLGIGDSFTFPFGVTIDECYLAQLESKQDLEVLKTGVPGYDVPEYLRFYRKVGRRFNPDIVVVGFYIGNDFLSGEKKISLREEKKNHSRVPGTIAINGFPQDFSEWISFFRNNYRTYGFVLDRAMSIKQLRKWITDFKYAIGVKAVSQFGPSFIELSRRELAPLSRRKWEATQELLTELHREVESDNAELVILAIPGMEQVDSQRWERMLKLYDADKTALDPMQANTRLEKFCRSRNILFFDSSFVLKNSIEEGNNPYFIYNGHFSAEGHKVVGQALSQFLLKNHR